MDNSELSAVAWDLVDHCRGALSGDDLTAAYVRLGVGEYSEAIEIALRSALPPNGAPLPMQWHERLARLQQMYYLDKPVLDLIAALSNS
ncbi:hypothetical protein C6A85_000000116205 [Mycobacterium sp. ITM-2017-0098]|nr:hypothetical protein C6A85_000000116205 [Mycobacterium sp. ITM-2017-0098]